MWGRKRELGQTFVHTSNFRVNRNLHDTCPVYCGLRNIRPMLEQRWFAVQVMVCGARVIRSNSNLVFAIDNLCQSSLAFTAVKYCLLALSLRVLSCSKVIL